MKNETIETSNSIKENKVSFFRIDQNNYLGQLPFVQINEDKEGLDMASKFNFAENLEDENVSWAYFDSLFTQQLTSAEKQNLSYIILSSKDLIGIYRSNPDKVLEERIKFHIDNLVSTKYIGYCLLYNALVTIEEDNLNYVKNKSTEILAYSAEDDYQRGILEDETFKNDPKTKMYYSKIKENFSYLKNLNNLATH